MKVKTVKYDKNLATLPYDGQRQVRGGKRAMRSLRFSSDQPRGADGKFTMGNVATFKNEADGISAHVTSFNGKYHVHLMDDDSGQVLPQSSIHSGDGAKEKAIAHAKKLVDMRFNPDQPRDPDGKFGSSTVGGAVSINDKEFEHQQVLSSHMQEALKNGSVESYSAFKAASDSMKNNMASTNLTDRAKDDAINNLKEHVKAAEKYGDKNAAAAFNAGIESLSR
jgi:hypothetical protein